MSQIIQSFDPSTLPSDQFTAPQSSGKGTLVFWNESNHRLTITFANGEELYCPAWYHRSKSGMLGGVNITWNIISVLASNQPPVSEVVVEAYDQGESFPADGPISERQTNLGNASTVLSAASSIINDGNVAGTSVVEATVAADPAGSAISWSNNAILQNGNATYPGSVRFDNGKITSNGTGKWSVAQNAFTLGSLSRITTVSIALGAGKTTINHGLGAIPDIVLITLQSSGVPVDGAGKPIVAAYNPATMTNTQVDIWSDGAINALISTIKF